jgi:hypothetical protein
MKTNTKMESEMNTNYDPESYTIEDWEKIYNEMLPADRMKGLEHLEKYPGLTDKEEKIRLERLSRGEVAWTDDDGKEHITNINDSDIQFCVERDGKKVKLTDIALSGLSMPCHFLPNRRDEWEDKWLLTDATWADLMKIATELRIAWNDFDHYFFDGIEIEELDDGIVYYHLIMGS